MNWGKRKSDNQSYVKKPKKSLGGVIGSTIPSTGKVKFAKPKVIVMSQLDKQIEWAETMLGKLIEPVPEDECNMGLHREQLDFWKKRLKDLEQEKKYKELEQNPEQKQKRSWW